MRPVPDHRGPRPGVISTIKLHLRLLRGKRGMALVLALLVLLVISVLATVLMVSINVESKITSHGVRETRALNYAEAGIGEAQARVTNCDISLDENPRAVAQIFNTLPGSVPVLGADSTALATAQPAGEWLPYSSASHGPNVLTVEYKTNAARTAIYRYDATRSPAVQTLSGEPIYVITSTGAAGGDVRKVRAEVCLTPIQATTYGALVANVGVELKGTIDVCGYNHDSSMPTGAGTWSTSAVTRQGAASTLGVPNIAQNQTGPFTGAHGFYAGPWDVFGTSQAEFSQWIGPPVSRPDPPVGLVHIDGDVAYHDGDGTGLLYVTGDLTLNGHFTYRGLVYVEGDLQINGQAWVLGGVIVKGNTTVRLATGTAKVFYSSETISEEISRASGRFTRVSWHEVF